MSDQDEPSTLKYEGGYCDFKWTKAGGSGKSIYLLSAFSPTRRMFGQTDGHFS